MDHRTAGILALASTLGCAQPELGLTIDGTEVLAGDVAALPSVRAHHAERRATVSVTNVGLGELEVEGIVTDAGVILFPAELPAVLAADETLTLEISLDPTGLAGPVDASLRVLSNDPDWPDYGVDLAGERTPYVALAVADRADVDSALDAEVARQSLVGAAVAVVEGQDLVYLRGFGFADREAGVAVDPSVHRFRWASLAKGLTALVAVQAVERGELELDEQVSALVADYVVPDLVLPEDCRSEDCAEPIPDGRQQLSLRQLLAHTGGVQHYTNGAVDPVPPFLETSDPAVNTGMAWALPYFWSAPLVAVPGEAFSYTTPGYNLAGVAVEEAAGDDLESLVLRDVAPELGITTLVADRGYAPVGDRVVGYRSGARIEHDDDVSWKLAGGGFTSSVEDLARYCAGLLGDVVVDTSLRDGELWREQHPGSEYGLGFGVRGSTVSHTGAQQSTRTALVLDRAEERCVVLMSNSEWADVGALYRAVRDAW